MFKRSLISLSVACAIALPGSVFAEDDEDNSGWEVSGYIKNETAVFVEKGQVTGQADTTLDTDGHDFGDVLKFENQARIFINKEFNENTSLHAELNLIYDTEGVNWDYRGHRTKT